MLETTNYKFKKPELADSPPDITIMNPNWDAIDAELKNHGESINSLDDDVVAHKAEKATQDEYGHIKLSDIPSPVVATQAEAEAGTNNTKMMTPLRVAESIDSRVRIIGNMVELFIAGEWVRFEEMVPWMPGIYTWGDVQRVVREGKANQYFNVGDQLVSLYDGQEIIWEIIGIDVETPVDSNFTHSMTLQTKDCLEDRIWEPSNDNRYINSSIRAYLNNDFLNKLDPELSAVLGNVNKKVAKRNDLGGGQDSFNDKVFLLSRVEVGLGTEGTTTGENVYSFYDGVANAARIKNLNGSPMFWWLRSPNVSNSYSERGVGTTGSLNSNSANGTLGVSPACVII